MTKVYVEERQNPLVPGLVATASAIVIATAGLFLMGAPLAPSGAPASFDPVTGNPRLERIVEAGRAWQARQPSELAKHYRLIQSGIEWQRRHEQTVSKEAPLIPGETYGQRP